MNQTKEGNQWSFGMKVHAGVVKDFGLIHSVMLIAASVHDLTPVDDLLHGDVQVVCADAGYQGIAKRPETAGKATEFRVAMQPGKRKALSDAPDRRLRDLIETAKAPIPFKSEHPFRVLEQQFSFQKPRLRGLAEDHCKIQSWQHSRA